MQTQRGFQDYNQDESPATYSSHIYISGQFGLKKTDQYSNTRIYQFTGDKIGGSQ